MGVDAIFDSENWSRVPFHFWTVVFFVFGSIVGSFLNVVIHRLPLGQSVVSPPSHCPHCKYSIPWYLNLPLLTWLWLGGKCRNCGAPISMRYFLVELLTAAAFSSCWLAFGDQSVWLALVFCLFLSLLIAGSFIDLEHFIIPDEITIGGLIAGFGCSVLLPRLHGEATLLASIGQCLLGAGVGAAVIYGIVRAGKLFLGRMHFELDPESRVVFDETGLQLPPKRLSLLNDRAGSGPGRFAVQASRVELCDRCVFNVAVGVSASKVIVGGETFERDAVPHLAMIVSRVLSVQRTARLFGERAGPKEVVAGWAAPLLRLISKGPSRVGPDAHIVMLEGGFWLCHEEMSFEEMLYRKSDTIHLFARRVLTPHGAWTDVPVRLSPERLQIGETTFNPEAVERMEVVTEKITVPREAMGLGDVKFMAAIGAFLGWPAVIFALAASSLFGSIVGVTLIALGIRDRSARLQYGPFIALAAVLWVFLPSEWQQKWLWQLQLLGRFLFRTPAPELP